MFSLAQAAKAAGKSRPTIARAIQAGRLSATKNDDGSYAIDPAELARVFPRAGDRAGTVKQSVLPNGAGNQPASVGEVEGLRALLAERDSRLAEKDASIADLRHRLDREAEDRRQAQAQLAAAQERVAALLTDQRTVPPPARRSWWPWRRAAL
jgi:hypothetical protein